jgi:hypothetical protein
VLEGNLIEGPYTLEIVNRKIVVNGWTTPPPPPSPPLTKSEQALEDLFDRAEKLPNALRASGTPWPVVIESVRVLFARSPLVDTVTAGGKSVDIKLRNGVQITFDVVPTTIDITNLPRTTQAEVDSAKLRELKWEIEKAGALIVMKHGGSIRSVHTGAKARRGLRAIERLRDGATLDSADIRIFEGWEWALIRSPAELVHVK